MTDYRADFDIPRDLCYLNAAYMTPLTHRQVAIAQEAAVRMSQPWDVRQVDFFTQSEAVRARAAQFFGAQSDNIALVPSVSYGLSIAVRNLRLAAGQAILVLADQFPSNIYPWRRLAAETNAEIITVQAPDDQDWTKAILSQIAALQDRLAIAAIPQVHWSTGLQIDLAAVGDAIKAAGAQLVLDLTQSLGAVPFSVASCDPDFVAVASYKWMMGPYSTGFLYVADRHLDGIPLEENWIARRGSEDFRRLVDYQDGYQAGARRFDVGEKSNFHLMPVLEDGLAWLDRFAAGEIELRLRDVTAALAVSAERAGLKPAHCAHRSANILGLFVGADAAQIAARLQDLGVAVTARGETIRLAPHLWVDQVDLEHFGDAIMRI